MHVLLRHCAAVVGAAPLRRAAEHNMQQLRPFSAQLMIESLGEPVLYHETHLACEPVSPIEIDASSLRVQINLHPAPRMQEDSACFLFRKRARNRNDPDDRHQQRDDAAVQSVHGESGQQEAASKMAS